MKHALIADADGTGFAGVDARDDKDFIFDLFLDLDQAMDIVEDSRFIVGRTGTDDEQEAVVLAGQDVFDFFIPFRLDGLTLSSMGNCSINSCGSGNFRIYSMCISIGIFPLNKSDVGHIITQVRRFPYRENQPSRTVNVIRWAL